MIVQFKFRESADAAARREVMARLRAAGARSVGQLFKNEKDPELASMYELQFAARIAAKVLAALAREEAIEFSEKPVARRLVR